MERRAVIGMDERIRFPVDHNMLHNWERLRAAGYAPFGYTKKDECYWFIVQKKGECGE